MSDEPRLAPWAVERSLWHARWVGVGVAFLQAAVLQPSPWTRPYAREATAAMGVVLALTNGLVLPALRRRRVTRTLATLAFSVDCAVIAAIVWLFTDNINAIIWPLLMIVPLEAAYRWRFRGAVGSAVAGSLFYTIVRLVSSREVGYVVTPADFTYVAGLLMVEAFSVGGMADRLWHEREALQKLHESSLALNSRLEPKAILAIVAREAARVLEADFAVVWVVDDESFVPAGAYRLPPGFDSTLRLPMSDPVFGEAAATRAYETGRTTMESGHKADRESHRPFLEGVVLPRAWKAVLSVPIVSEGQTLGVLSCYMRQAHRFDPDEVSRVESLAALAAVAITNASAYERESSALAARKELDALKDDFLSTISHELRTPLTAVEGFATTLRRRWDDISDDARRDFVARIERQANSLHGLIRELLDFSRLQSGRFSAHGAPLDVSSMVAETVHRLDAQLAGHDVKVDVPADLVCYADPLALDRVLENLLTNAARYSPDGTPILVRAGIPREAGMAGWVELAVIDAGIGIPASEQARVFQRFYRGQSDEVRKVRGTGVGLAVVKELVEANGGDVSVKSTPGEGSTFTVRLPSRAPTVPAPEARS